MKLVIQHDAMQCGVASLAMVFSHYGKDYSMKFLEDYCHSDAEGMSLLGLSQAAEELGLHAVCGRSNISVLSSAPLPAILHWNQNHFVVLTKVMRGGKKFRIADPACGFVDYTAEEFKERWISTRSNGEERGIVMFLTPTPQFYESDNDKSKTEKRSFSFLMGYMKQHSKYFIQIILGLIVGCAIQFALPFLMQDVVDVGIGNRDISLVWLIMIGQLVLIISGSAIDFIRRRLLLHISMWINISLISDFFIKLLKLPMGFFDVKQVGDISQRIEDHERVEKFLTDKSLGAVFSLLCFIVFVCVLFHYSVGIFAVFMLAGVAYAGWMALFLKKRKVLDYMLFDRLAGASNKTYEFITSMQEVKLQNCRLRRRYEWEDVQSDIFDVRTRVLKMQQAQEAGGIFINQVKNIVITIMSATAVIDGGLTLGMMMAIQYIVGQLNSPMEQIMEFLYSVQDVRISLERINEIHEVSDENDDSRTVDDCPKEGIGIEFNKLNFKYNVHQPENTLEDVSVLFPHGSMTAIVGASGSGKTTMIKLMLGYYKPTEGNISINGVDLATANLDNWRKRCGVVMQDGFIFSESIARNIAIEDGDIDEERLVKAAETACILDFIMSLPLQFNTKVGMEGIGLSQGQRQRILIARAVYKNPDYIFLDEATNALDAKNERKIVENLDKFYCGKTVIVAAHRLSTVSNADQIIVLDNGKIVEMGNHETLTAKHGYYYNLVKNQLELGS